MQKHRMVISLKIKLGVWKYQSSSTLFHVTQGRIFYYLPYQYYNKSNMTGATCGAGTTDPSRASEFTTGF